MESPRILVVDDHQLLRKGIVAAIKDERPQWEVCGEAATGRDAVSSAERLKPHIVVMDISMPDMNGLEATRQIRKASPDTQVLILSVHESDQIVREVLDCGARGYLLKSDAGADLMDALDALLNNRLFFTSKVSEALLRAYRNGSSSEGANIMAKLELHSISDLIRYAIRNGLIEC